MVEDANTYSECEKGYTRQPPVHIGYWSISSICTLKYTLSLCRLKIYRENIQVLDRDNQRQSGNVANAFFTSQILCLYYTTVTKYLRHSMICLWILGYPRKQGGRYLAAIRVRLGDAATGPRLEVYLARVVPIHGNLHRFKANRGFQKHSKILLLSDNLSWCASTDALYIPRLKSTSRKQYFRTLPKPSNERYGTWVRL